jgi:SAM-dependent methyltransferase
MTGSMARDYGWRGRVRALARRLLPDLKTYLALYEPAEDIPRHDASEVLAILERLAAIRQEINRAFVLKEGHEQKVDLDKWAAQSQIFVVDCIPYILETLRANHRRGETVTLLDVGCATGAGTALLKSLLSTNMLWCPVEVTGIDVFPNRVICAKNNFPDFEYVVSDIFKHERRYDYVFCSHTLEHVVNPAPFIRRLAAMARRNVFIYTPHAEQERISGHRWSISESFYDKCAVERFVKIKSPGWQWARPEQDFCLLAILRGGG